MADIKARHAQVINRRHPHTDWYFIVLSDI
jgi:hypothetical protein